jgi:two-component system, OmpR family, response regulator
LSQSYTAPVGLRVLVAAANPATAVQMEMLLGMDGHDVRLARDEPSALRAVEAYDPDVLLLDEGVPGLDDREFARRLKRRNVFKAPLLIEMGGRGDDCRQAANTGVDLHLPKPVDPVFLLDLLRRFQRVVG